MSREHKAKKDSRVEDVEESKANKKHKSSNSKQSPKRCVVEAGVPAFRKVLTGGSFVDMSWIKGLESVRRKESWWKCESMTLLTQTKKSTEAGQYGGV